MINSLAHGGGRVEQHRQKVLLHVPYLGGVLLQAVHDKLDVGAVQLQEAGTHHLMGEVRPGNPGGLTLRADGFHQKLHDLVQILPVGSKPLFEAVILDILQNQLPITLKSLMGANAKAKANAATAIPELIQISSNPAFEENRKEKHNKNAKYGWYRYDVRFALPVYEENTLVRYNIFHARLLINHAENGRKYLYDILAVKKETSKP